MLGHLQKLHTLGGDKMLKTLSAQIKEYKKPSILAPFFIVCEVIVELLIPFLMASIIDKGVSSDTCISNRSNNGFYGNMFTDFWCIKW